MTSRLLFQDPAGFVTPLLVVFAVDIATGKDDPPSPALLTTSDAVAAAAAPWLGYGEFKATLAETAAPAPSGRAQGRASPGDRPRQSEVAHRERAPQGRRHRDPPGPPARHPRASRSRFPRTARSADEHLDTLPCYLAARAVAEGALLADFDIDTYRTDRKDQAIHSVTVLFPEADDETRNDMQRGWDEGVILGESQNFTRSLVNEPGNVLTPTELGRRAAAMAKEYGLACEVHSTDKLQELKMGAFLAVAQGSAEPPALIVLRYEPPTAPAADAPVLGLVGKGITFDTGGISIKPADNMDKMKYDMAGAAAMIGAMRAIALLKPAVRVICVICSCENMPAGRAYKPGDVLTAMSGKTIEVMNTDAEGRLVLADGLHYAQTLGATHLINAATLTGAIGIALGQLNAGLFSNDDETTRRFLDGYPVAGEKFWRLPCTDDYREQIKSSDRRHHEHRRLALRRSHRRRHVPQGVRRRHTLDPPRHRRHRLDRRTEALAVQRPQRHRRPQHHRVGPQPRKVAVSIVAQKILLR